MSDSTFISGRPNSESGPAERHPYSAADGCYCIVVPVSPFIYTNLRGCVPVISAAVGICRFFYGRKKANIADHHTESCFLSIDNCIVIKGPGIYRFPLPAEPKRQDHSLHRHGHFLFLGIHCFQAATTLPVTLNFFCIGRFSGSFCGTDR